MTDADNTDEYEQRVQTIQRANQAILDGFAHWLRQTGLSEHTITEHVENIRFFTAYLVYYDFSARRLDQATSTDVYGFLGDWFPRKAMWASVTSVKGYLASFRKFFKWLGASGMADPEVVDDVLFTLKDSRDEFFRAAE